MSRFERKILVAIMAVAVVPAVAALLLGLGALRESYQVGVNPKVRGELEKSLEVYRQHFVSLRLGAEQGADAIARDWALREMAQAADRGAMEARLRTLVEGHESLARVRVLDGDDRTLADVEYRTRLEGSVRTLELERPIEGIANGPRLLLTVSTPSAPFADYQRAGELVEVFGRLEASTGEVSGFYLAVYMAFLFSVVVLTLIVGIVISRRVTRRVAVLADATRVVGAGDLSVQIPSDVNDEIGELTEAFNEMVRDIRDSRTRIEYLQRIGAWQQFARRLAHEIKNPLTPIQLAVQEVHRSYDGSDAVFRKRLDDAMHIVGEEVATLRRLVGEFSAFAKLPEADLEEADLNDFLSEGARVLEGIAEEFNDTLDTPVIEVEPGDDGPLPVRIDAMMLRRAADNLVRNGLQAIRDGAAQGTARVRVSTRRLAGQAVIEVADSGPGIAEADRERIFDPYYTTRPDGTGLGLAIVKKIVLEHDGEITCLAGPLGGALFRIALPLRG